MQSTAEADGIVISFFGYVVINQCTGEIKFLHWESLGSPKLLQFILNESCMNDYTEFHGDPSNGYWDTALWAQMQSLWWGKEGK